MKSDKIEELRTLLAPAVEAHSAFLVDVNLKGDGKRQILEVFCETEKGITIGECAEISRELLPRLDSSNVIGDSFRLEVSSPGVGSVLKDRRQYKTNAGRLLAVKYRDGEEEKYVEGDLSSSSDEKIVLNAGDTPREIGFDSILEARVKIRW